MNAAYATGSATASAGASPAPPTTSPTSSPWYRSTVFWTAASAIGTIGAAVIAYFTLVK